MAQRIDASRAPLAAAADEASAALKAIASRLPTAPAAARETMTALRDRIAEAAGVAIAVNPRNAWSLPPRRLDSLRFVRSACDALYDAVEGADAAPSPDARAGLARLEPMARQALASWEALKARELAAANRRLEQAGEKPIELAPPQ
jgi:hypothetical protein